MKHSGVTGVGKGGVILEGKRYEIRDAEREDRKGMGGRGGGGEGMGEGQVGRKLGGRREPKRERMSRTYGAICAFRSQRLAVNN